MKVYILEDEVNIREYILSLAGDIPYLQVVGYAAEIATAQKEIQQLQPDLILADIELKDGTCFTLFNTIKTDAHIIFITAYNQYAIDALNLGAFAYLLKPIDTAAFNNTIDRCYKKIEAYRLTKQQLEITDSHYQKKDTPRRIVLKNFDFIQIVAMKDIVYCQSDKGYTTFHLQDGSKIIMSKVLKEYEALLPEDTFIRCHQSYIVNVNYISRYYKEGELLLTNTHKIPVSDRKKSIVIDYIERLT
ncbi:LytR/AlgR family response regulator transcription factor [Ohtaekwangia koreensis]|uniref:Two component transcriptional regulator, LytTR family n=1 Tax=Ohtaekwangia koreensis TaxID=688867 RepID=A0A1T5KJW3_9BACT|nr:LytTR family DNA-binding domain-containing protein [Ohtaekwangia koreensis]SKC64032.1 two component transcriptional regulator, LytTR family [Ohtaekwangia koreensis]